MEGGALLSRSAFFVVVSGLPASGKTAIGRRLAERLAIPFIDKDDLLEAEFEKYDQVDPEMRHRLSRKCDDAMADKAKDLGSGVLVSFWRPPDLDVSYGTSTRWIAELDVPVVELHCRCEPLIAERRFRDRQRHAGHNDPARLNGLNDQLNGLAALGPLGCWPLVTVDTSALDEITDLTERAMRQILDLV